jgi:enediyne polyketide synthase
MVAATDPIAIVGAACRYADAADPEQLWQSVLGRRRGFRPIPPARLGVEYRTGPDTVDHTYVRYAAVLENWQFDRERHRIPGPTYRAADHTHWLALDVAANALAGAGYPDGDGLDRARVGAVVGNSLTGEFSRAGLLRLRWPYVRKVVAATLADEDWPADRLAGLLERLERAYKAPFVEPSDETLAGGLANTIAGRVCNHFDLRGGGYTVDGACASSLIAVVTACNALVADDLDVAIAGGVDLSLDPFELVGFARTGALAREPMRVYDANPTGFWPGEGAGMVVLMRASDAAAAGREPLALIRGWGLSSDGRGGITRPEVSGQLLALRRAYGRAGFGPETVALFEGHGTGTAVGDAVEIEALTAAHLGPRPAPAALGSIKANIGHTKAAAGLASLLKVTQAVRHQVIPPTTGCVEPHPALRRPDRALDVVEAARPWPDEVRRAGVSAAGFGGINTHVVIEGAPAAPRLELAGRERILVRRPTGHEVVAVAGDDLDEVAGQLGRLAGLAATLSYAELTDLAASLASALAEEPGAVRAAIVADEPVGLAARCGRAAELLRSTPAGELRLEPGVAVGNRAGGRVGLLFTGQGAPVPSTAGALGDLLAGAGSSELDGLRPVDGDSADTAVAQPGIVAASLLGLRWLAELGVHPVGAVGHSLGEITALHWAGVFDAGTAVGLATARGRLMADLGAGGTTMAAVAADAVTVANLLAGTGLVVAADNGPGGCTVAGAAPEVAELVARATAQAVPAKALPVRLAFHSSAVAPVVAPFKEVLTGVRFEPPRAAVYSTVTAAPIEPHDDVAALLADQITAPVRFGPAVSQLAAVADLLLEVGPGRGLAGLAGRAGTPAVSLDVGAPSAEAVATSTAAMFAAGAVPSVRPFYRDRFFRPLDPSRDRVFLTNPCDDGTAGRAEPGASGAGHGDAASAGEPAAPPQRPASPLDIVQNLVAAALEVSVQAVRPADQLLSDLHLNSLRVAQIAAAAAATAGRQLPAAPLSLADSSVSELAALIDALPEAVADTETTGWPAGVAAWFRCLVPQAQPVADLPEAMPRRWRLRGAAPADWPAQEDPAAAGTDTIVFFLPADPDDGRVADLVAACREAIEEHLGLVVVDHGDTASGLLGSLAQEFPDRSLLWIRAHAEAPTPVLVRLAAAVCPGLREWSVTAAGDVHRTGYGPAPQRPNRTSPFDGNDVVLVTGGAKGIGFEAALALSRRYRVRLALVGRSPDSDAEVHHNLARLRAGGAVAHYISADVADPSQVGRLVAEATEAVGPVTAVVHAAGVNRPAAFGSLTPADFEAHAAAKHRALAALLEALPVGPLRTVVTFGSVIGRFGLAGEAHYALANGRLRELVRVNAERWPDRRFYNLDWTAWSGAGMGERLDVLDGLVRAGVDPIPVADAIRLLFHTLEGHPPTHDAVLTGRLPHLHGPVPATFRRRFVERVPVHVAGVELVAEAALGLDTDPYLADHRIDGTPVLPAVAAIEAMAQAAHALTGGAALEARELSFHQPIVVPESGTRTIRICALRRPTGGTDVVLRSEETGYAVDHFTAFFPAAPCGSTPPPVRPHVDATPEHDGADLYGPLFFHGHRFRRLRRYMELTATRCTAALSDGQDTEWFGGDHVRGLLLGDLGRADASIHVLQGCVPHRRLLPVGAERLVVHDPTPAAGTLLLAAEERRHDGKDYVYDVVLMTPDGDAVADWTGLRLRDVGPIAEPATWPAILLGPYLVRSLATLMPDHDVRLIVTRCVRSARDRDAAWYAVDGRPDPPDGDGWSRSRLDGVALTAAGASRLACDWEPVVEDAEVPRLRELTPWPSAAAQLARVADEPESHLLSRLWTVQECLSKVGRPGRTTGLTVVGGYAGGWILLRAGDDVIASTVLCTDVMPRPTAVAVLTGGPR